MTSNVTTTTVDLFATVNVEVPTTARRDSRDWRNVATEDRPKRRNRGQQRRTATRKAAVRQYLREGGW